MGKEKNNILVEGRNCWRIVRASRVSFLIDSASYFSALAAALQRARRSVFIVGWDIDSRIRLLRGDDGEDMSPRLGRFLNRIVSANPELNIYILCWDFAMIYVLERELFPIFKMNWAHRRIHFRLDGNHPVGASHHQKIVVVDDKIAFAGGIDLARRRWDTPKHYAEDERRVDTAGRPYPPTHDVQMAVDGEAAAALGQLARERWLRATRRRLRPPVDDGSDPWPRELKPDLENVHVGIARTQPAYKNYPEVREVERLYVDCINSAERFVYIENQYLTSATVGEAITARLQEEDGPEFVIVVPVRSAGWLSESTMDVCRSRMLKRLRKEDPYRRLHVYYPIVPNLGDSFVNVHSKVLVVDNDFVRIGSSNINNRSMGLDTECDLAIEAAGDQGVEKSMAAFRNRLLGQHLGASADKVGNIIEAENSLVAASEKLRDSERTLVPLDGEVPKWIDNLVPDTAIVDPERPIDPERLIDEFVAEEDKSAGVAHIWRNAFILLALLGLAGAWRWTPLAEWLTLQNIKAVAMYVSGHSFAPLLVMASYIIGSLVMIPIILMIVGTVLIFGPMSGFAYSLVGSLLSAVCTYGVGRNLGRDTVRRLAGRKVNRLSRRLAKHGIAAILVVRIFPVAPFTVVNMIAGASHIRFWDFVLGTFLGMAPGIVAITIFGHGLEATIREPKVESFAFLAVWAAVIVLAVIAIRKFLGESGKDNASSNRE